MEIIIPLIAFISGMILAYVGYRYQVSRDKLSSKRERLLNNISKVERFLTLTVEMETVHYQLQDVEREFQEIHKELDLNKIELKK